MQTLLTVTVHGHDYVLVWNGCTFVESNDEGFPWHTLCECEGRGTCPICIAVKSADMTPEHKTHNELPGFEDE